MASEKILIVEDEQIVGLEIRGMIEDLGYEVCGVESTGEAALEFVEDNQVDLIMMDIKLAGDLNGIETIKKMKEAGTIISPKRCFYNIKK